MRFLRFVKNASATGAGEISVENEALIFKLDILTLEKKVTAYFQQWRDPVNRYVVAAFGNPMEAEEITQEAFLQLYRQLHSGQSITNVRAWVFRTAHNLAVNRIKGRQFVELLDEDGWELLRGTIVDTSPNPEQQLLKLERLGRLRTAVARLTPPERQCLHLRTKGLRYREIAEILGVGTSTVADTLYRVISKLTEENNG